MHTIIIKDKGNICNNTLQFNDALRNNDPKDHIGIYVKQLLQKYREKTGSKITFLHISQLYKGSGTTYLDDIQGFLIFLKKELSFNLVIGSGKKGIQRTLDWNNLHENSGDNSINKINDLIIEYIWILEENMTINKRKQQKSEKGNNTSSKSVETNEIKEKISNRLKKSTFQEIKYIFEGVIGSENKRTIHGLCMGFNINKSSTKKYPPFFNGLIHFKNTGELNQFVYDILLERLYGYHQGKYGKSRIQTQTRINEWLDK